MAIWHTLGTNNGTKILPEEESRRPNAEIIQLFIYWVHLRYPFWRIVGTFSIGTKSMTDWNRCNSENGCECELRKKGA